VESRCSKAQLSLSWRPSAEQANLEFKVCAVAKDNSVACMGKGPPSAEASSRGWMGEQQCVKIKVLQPDVSWTPDPAPNQVVSYVGCTSRIVVRARDCSSSRAPACSGEYRVFIRSLSLPDAAQVLALQSSPGHSSRVMEWVPKRGHEGSVATACFTAGDELETRAPIAPQCWSFTVEKCQYCLAGGADTLHHLIKELALDTNWLRIWLHNGNYPAQNKGQVRVTNPDLILKSHNITTLDEQMGNYRGQPIVWAGVMYEAREEETLSAVAVRFRTTVGSLLQMNPDISDDVALTRNRLDNKICIIPCATSAAPASSTLAE